MQNNPTVYVLGVLIAFSIFMRIRRSIGFRLYKAVLLYIRASLCGVLFLVTLAVDIGFHPETIINPLIGAVLGLGLVYLAVRHSTFEKREKGIYYRTHFWIEIGVITLFMVRIFYRFYLMYNVIGSMKVNQPPPDNMRDMRDPITGIILGLFCAYYIAYYAYVIKEAEILKKSTDIQTIQK